MRVYRYILLLILGMAPAGWLAAQEEKKTLLIDLKYNLQNNRYPYLLVFTKTKEEKKFLPVPRMEVNVYFGEATDDRLMNRVITDEKGRALIPVNAKFKQAWDSAWEFRFIAEAPGSDVFGASEAEISIRKAKIYLDSVAGGEGRMLSATVMEQQNGLQLPAAEVELKVIIKRMAGNLSVGDEELYTTDSSGTALASFMKDSLPGDREGYLWIVAKTEDNDLYGNISVEKSFKWGEPFIAQSGFDKRSLYATRDKSPLWLLVLAYAAAAGVWATIIYLLTRIWIIRKAGLAAPG